METDADTLALLERLGLSMHAELFRRHAIDDASLLMLGDADLREIGIDRVGHRKKILAAISELRRTRGTTGERRQVTIVFADLCGFTALAQRVDAEELHRIVECYATRVDAIVERWGGTVDKHIGDAVMALFGAPVAHADDPLRAVRAALEVHDAMRALSDEVGRSLRVHVGVASGEVVAGGLRRGAGHDYTVLGDAVNLAARLDALAAPGETLLSESVYRAVAAEVECVDRGEHVLKGIAAAERVFAVTRLRDRSERGPLVGRHGERGQLLGLVDRVLTGRGGAVALLVGEAGIGKTRLAEDAILQASRVGFEVHRAAVVDFGAARWDAPVALLWRSLLATDDDAEADLPAWVAERLDEADRPLVLDIIDRPLDAAGRALLEAMPSEVRSERRARALGTLLRARMERSPQLLAIEDLHWADADTAREIEALVAAARRSGALVLLTARPFDGSATCSDGFDAVLDLGPLSETEALELARASLGAGELARRCVERAAGHPLFLEQLVKSAPHEQGRGLPSSVQSVVLARMDRLPASDKRALQTASILGQRFELAMLRQLLGSAYDPHRLRSHGLLHGNERQLCFAHALIHEGVYASMLKAVRAALHARAAALYEESDSTLWARHLDRAGDARAASAYRLAAEQERARSHGVAATDLCRRGLELARGAERVELLLLRGDLALDACDIEAAQGAFGEARQSAADDRARCRALLGEASAMRVGGRLDAMLALIDRARALAEQGAFTREQARLHGLRGAAFFTQGRLDDCEREHRRALDLAGGIPELEALAWSGLGDAEYAIGRMRTAHAHFARCVALCREHGLGRVEVANLPMELFTRRYAEEGFDALAAARGVYEASERVGNRRALVIANHVLCFELLEACAEEEALRLAAAGRRLASALGARVFEAECIWHEGRALRSLGRRREARAKMREALEIYSDAPAQFFAPLLVGGQAALEDDPDERARLYARAETLLTEGALAHNHFWFRREAIEDALDRGEWDAVERHADALESFTAAEVLPWSGFVIERARHLSRRGGPADAASIVARAQALGFAWALPKLAPGWKPVSLGPRRRAAGA